MREQRESLTISELLDLPVEEGVYVETYAVGSEPSSAPRGSSGPRARRVDPRILDRFLPEARAGASDAAIAKSAGVKPDQVARWRRRNDVARTRGRPTRYARAASMAVELMGHPFEPVVAEVRTSILGGRFEPPQYILRDGLDYDLFVELIDALAAAGYRDDELAVGLGVREVDVAIARLLSTRAAA